MICVSSAFQVTTGFEFCASSFVVHFEVPYAFQWLPLLHARKNLEKMMFHF